MDNTTVPGHPRKNYVYQKLEELRDAIKWDSFDLNRDEQDAIEIRLDEFKREVLDKFYAK